MAVNVLDKILRMGEGRALRKLEDITRKVNALESQFEAMSDLELKEQTQKFKERYKNGESLNSILPEAFATVRQGAQRTLGQRHFDVQIMGGAALHQGKIAEMKTGEGKTLVSTLPAYLNAITGKGVHIVTVNDYLAQYQSELMGRVYRFLGLTCGCILTPLAPQQRKEEYACDITYGTNNEFGFDYLRDNMAWNTESLVQRGHNFAIIDEVDSILIDEARTPLIISGPAQGDLIKWYKEFAKLARQLVNGTDYESDEKKKTIGVLEPGIEKVEKALGIDNLYNSVNTPLIGFLNNSIKAKELFKRDKDYIVARGEVLIVDEHTGRVLDGRRYNEGMHQAIEAKEGVKIKEENQTLATITLQNYFRLYNKMSGMTGTAQTEAAEFQGTYNMGVIPIPTNMPMVRQDMPDFIYKTLEGKYNAIINDIQERHELGQPILIGTASVETNELVSKMLKMRGIPHNMLNAKQHKKEAEVIAMAGVKGAVTVATNMAGRGTDIMLGGNAEFLATKELSEKINPEEEPEEYEKAWGPLLEQKKEQVLEDHDKVVELGGLYVLGTERHESRRIDNQLRGRSGRQGDPGESRFYLSLQDELMRLFATGMAGKFLNSSLPEGIPIENKTVSRAIASAQAQVESRNFEIRKEVLKYDDVMSDQRKIVYSQRQKILEKENLGEQVKGFIPGIIQSIVDEQTAFGNPEEWDLDKIWVATKEVFTPTITPQDIIDEVGSQKNLSTQVLTEELTADANLAYENREKELGKDILRSVERSVLLQVVDRKWCEHLYEVDYLKEGIGLRAMAQKDPLVEYKTEAYQMFQSMNEAIKFESLGILFNAEINQETQEEENQTSTATQNLQYSQPDLDTNYAGGAQEEYDGNTKNGVGSVGVKTVVGSGVYNDGTFYESTPANAPCPCGSGEKYKKCHGKNDPALQDARAKKSQKKGTKPRPKR